MKKILKIVGILALVAVVGIVGAVAVFAQRSDMPDGFNPWQMREAMMNGEMPEGFNPQAMRRGFTHGDMPEGFSPHDMPEGFGPGNMTEHDGKGFMAVDEEAMHEVIADALGLSVDEFEAAIEAGQTPEELAAEAGIEFAELEAVMKALHADSLQQAVDDGLITQEQADFMLERMEMMGEGHSSDMQGRIGHSGDRGHEGECPVSDEADLEA